MNKPDFNSRFSVQVLRSGQPRAYADTEREYKVLCERWQDWGKAEEQGWKPSIPLHMNGLKCDENGVPTDPHARETIDNIVRGTCQRFWRSASEPGATWAHPILKWMKVDSKAGIIHVLIIEAYTD
jgi:hypothetical protein